MQKKDNKINTVIYNEFLNGSSKQLELRRYLELRVSLDLETKGKLS